MSRRFRPSDAFVDESIRGQRYLMCCVVVEARHLAVVHRTTLDLVAPGKRLHFHQELDTVRRDALDVFAAMPIRVDALIAVRRHGVTEFAARAACLAPAAVGAADRGRRLRPSVPRAGLVASPP